MPLPELGRPFAGDLRERLREGAEGCIAHIGRDVGYAKLREQIFASAATLEFGDPRATAAAILKIVDAENPPLRFFLGTEGMPAARAAYAARLSTWESWETESNAAQGVAKQHAIASL